MKKIVLFAAAIAAISFTSCGNKTNANQSTGDSDSITVVDTASVAQAIDALADPSLKSAAQQLTSELTKNLESNDPNTLTSTLAALQLKYQELVNSGKLEEAKKYGAAIKTFIKDNQEKIKQLTNGNATVNTLVNGIINLPTSAEATIDQAKAAVSGDLSKLVTVGSAAAAAIKNMPEAAKDAAANAANAAAKNAEDAAKAKVNEEAAKAQNKANEAINKASEKATQKVNDAAKNAIKGLGL